MFSNFRKKIASGIVLFVLGLGVLSLVFTDFGTSGMGGIGALSGGAASDSLVTVEGRPITEAEASDLLNRQFSQAREQQPNLDLRTFLASGAFDQVLNRLIIGQALMAFGREQSLAVSQRMIDREIVNIPAFRNFAGQFDEASFRQALAAQNLTEGQLREDIARTLMQRQLLMPLALAARVPEGIAREYASLLLERRRGTIGVVPAELMGAGIEPTEAEVAAFYRANRAAFTIPERRVVQYALLGREQVAEAAAATDQEIEAFYRQNAATYGARQTRNLQQVVLPDQAAANAFAARVRGGTAFADAASQAGFSAADITLADQNPQGFAAESSPEVARAAFAAAQGAVVGPIRSELGFHVVRVERINTVAARPLAAVRDEIAAAIQQRKLADALGDLIGRVEDKIAEGASFEEVARSERLAVVTTPPITATGQAPGRQWQAPPELGPLLRSAFEIDAEAPEPVVETLEPNERFALLGISQVVPAAPPPLAQIRDQVRAALIQRRALERARAVAQSIVARINAGMPARQAFAETQPRLPAPQAIDMRRLDISSAGEQVPPPLATLFSLPQRRAQILEAPNGAGWFVVHHEQRTPGDASAQPQLIASTRAEFTRSAGDELVQQFARAVELQSDIERNEEAIAAARRRQLGLAAE